ncbi:SCAN domain-containing protein 3 [Merluccius polli]|uniref:SCAN domain-containing protein 3 n=1 Tax=Merluccius polli TaxID=89951 RepID=A0AA47MLT6_MERPO|nr:SCAN domain-containing protein 3 [Merluccius polli]
MACSKRRKVDAEKRCFKDEWTEKCMFILPAGSSKPVCLICSENVALIKSGNMKRHYEIKHSSFEESFPLKSELRAHKITNLPAQYDRSTRLITQTFTAQQQRANKCSLRVSWILGQHKKHLVMGQFPIADTLFEGKQKDEMCEKIKQIPMSASTATRNSEILADDVLAQLDAAIRSAPCRSLAIDESTDVTDNAQLLVYVRFFQKDKELCALAVLDGGQGGPNRHWLCEELLGVTPLETHTRREDIYAAIRDAEKDGHISEADGAPAMVGKERGAVPRMKEDNPDLIANHCLIHSTVLCATLSEHFAEHHLLREFLEDVEANANDLLLHNNVRWLSKGNALGRFWSIRTEIAAFLKQVKSQKATQFSLFLQDEHKMDKESVNTSQNCRNRFREVTQTFKWAHAGSLQLELIDLQGNAALREHFEATDPATFWLQTVSESVFPGLTKVALHTLTMFGSTYSCESAFSTMNIIKSKYRSRLTNEHLHVCMRMALTPFQPRFKSLAGQSHAHFSHSLISVTESGPAATTPSTDADLRQGELSST